MGYQPILADIPQTSGYQPSLADIPAASQLAQIAANQAEPKEVYKPQMQEEFSNPQAIHGFEQLSPQQQRQKMLWAQTDPSNQTATGGFVPGGAYESPVTRMAASVIPTLAAPELRMGAPIVRGAVNALSRVGAGTAGNVAYESPNIKTPQDLMNVAKEGASMNAVLEIPTFAAKGIRGAAEIYNPSYRYAEQKANEIRNEASAARALQRQTYRPVFDRYGDQAVTQDASQFMQNAGIERRYLYPEAKKIYDEFMQNPTFQRLHDLQSKIGGDIRKANMARNKPLTEQRFGEYRSALQNNANQFLANDANALNQYNMGSQITRNLVEPFNANPTLKQISRGTRQHITPSEITGAIKRGREKIVYERGNNAITAIPENHPLNRHMNEINSRLDLGQGLQSLVPKFAKSLLPDVGGVIQNPLLNTLMERASPLYYGAGRSGINSMNELQGS